VIQNTEIFYLTRLTDRNQLWHGTTTRLTKITLFARRKQRYCSR